MLDNNSTQAQAETVKIPSDFEGMAAYLDSWQESGEKMDWQEFDEESDSWTNEPGYGETSHSI